MLQYEDLTKLKQGDKVYYVGELSSYADDYEEEGITKIWKLKIIGSDDKRCMLECPDQNLFRFDVFKDKKNEYPMFSLNKKAEIYLKELNAEIHESLNSMSTEEILEEIFRVYESCFGTYEVPFTHFNKDQVLIAKKILKNRLGLV